MRLVCRCAVCGSSDIDYLGDDIYYCHDCEKKVSGREEFVMHPYEARRAAVYATGNRWAIENWEATH